MLNKADLHIHTTFSDGLMTPEAVVEYVATQTDLRVIAISDHDTIEGAMVARRYQQCYPEDFGHVEIIIASEITSRDGDILGLYLSSDVPAGMSAAETVEAIHAQGGLAIAVHPYSFVAPMLFKGVKGRMHTLPFDGVETRNAAPTPTICPPWARLLRSWPVTRRRIFAALSRQERARRGGRSIACSPWRAWLSFRSWAACR